MAVRCDVRGRGHGISFSFPTSVTLITTLLVVSFDPVLTRRLVSLSSTKPPLSSVQCVSTAG
ncbi:hypothetical protein Taro_024671 [Colocasia esculenta]|uniref:Uncharacterized protein n=1 Tax=Colocasia esculenta TaxID=4460 RepID=A0A843VBZ5_COLES|nr:hypothetical protein [Colocasia esculenta]